MKRIGLIVTGRCEALALPQSLQSYFEQLGADVAFECAQQVNSFTSAPVARPPQIGVRTNADNFAAAVCAHVEESQYDFVIGVDDVEPGNFGNEAAVVAVLREGLDGHLAAMPEGNRLRPSLKAKASFHLIGPMAEALFFPDPESIARTGALRPSLFQWPARDFEDFEVDDPEFLAQPVVTHPPDLRARTWAIEGRARHPKAYLRFLVQPNPYRTSPRYQETRQGVAALRELDWNKLVAESSLGRLARSLLDDLAWALDVDFPARHGDLHESTRFGGRPHNLLRNI